MKRGNLAVSTALSTIILASVLLVIVGIASIVANNAINFQIEGAQFEQAKNIMLATDKIVKKMIFAPRSSGYVRSSFLSMTPQFTETGENLTLTIDADGENWTYQIPVNIVKIKGGAYVGVSSSQNLLGNASILLTDLAGSLGRIWVYQSDGAWISLDYSRTRCIYTGTSDLFNGSCYEPLNVIEVTLINLTFGVIEPDAQAFIIVQNLGTDSGSPLEVSGNFKIKVSSPDGEETKSLEELGGDSSKPTLIHLAFIKIEISIVKGV